jgi:hypothetical protein
VTDNPLESFNYIICVGLNFDDRGFLAWYKEQNPQGIIIALDFYKPSYLGDEDFWFDKNLHTLLMELSKKVTSNKVCH